jgi:hypothetical protein
MFLGCCCCCFLGQHFLSPWCCCFLDNSHSRHFSILQTLNRRLLFWLKISKDKKKKKESAGVYFPHFYKRENIVYFFRGDATFSMDDASLECSSLSLSSALFINQTEKKRKIREKLIRNLFFSFIVPSLPTPLSLSCVLNSRYQRTYTVSVEWLSTICILTKHLRAH